VIDIELQTSPLLNFSLESNLTCSVHFSQVNELSEALVQSGLADSRV